MKIHAVCTVLLALIPVVSAADDKKDFGRDHVLIHSDWAARPYVAAVAEKAFNPDRKSPPAEVRGGTAKAAFKRFCLGLDSQYPDVVAAAREMTSDEYERCKTWGVTEIIKVKIGYEAGVVVMPEDARPLRLTRKMLFQAVARDVPNDVSKRDGDFHANPFSRWKEIDESLPDAEIHFVGAEPGSRAEKGMKTLMMEGGCRQWDWVREMKHHGGYKNSQRIYRAVCHDPRRDGRYHPASGAGAKAMKELLGDRPGAVGYMDFNSWSRGADGLQVLAVEGIEPSMKSITAGLYPLSRAYHVYIKKPNIPANTPLADFLIELTSDAALGRDGYLAKLGLVPMTDGERTATSEHARAMEISPPPGGRGDG